MKNQNELSLNLGANFQGLQAILCFLGFAGYGISALVFTQITAPLLVMGVALLTIGLFKTKSAFHKLRFESKLIGNYRRWFTLDELVALKKYQGWGNSRLIGWGFIWDKAHCQNVADFFKDSWRKKYRQSFANAKKVSFIRDHLKMVITKPSEVLQVFRVIDQQVASEPGYRWIHALGDEKVQCISGKDLEGHMAVFGTTGAGKSRFLELQIVQAILEGKTVIVLDPKGDQALVQSVKYACDKARRGNDFLYFHLAHPDKSININLLANYSREDEVASRIVDTLPGQGGEGQVFIDMGRGALRTICDGIKILGKKPTFLLLHHYFANRQELALKVLETVLPQSDKKFQEKYSFAESKTAQKRLTDLINLYRSKGIPSPELDGIIALAERDEESFQKTTQSTWLLLSTLTRGDLGKKLSPIDDESQGNLIFYDTRKIIDKHSVLYVGLDALTDSGMAKTIGSMVLSDLAATAGARYDFETSSSPVALFVDEAAELSCEPFTQMLNKSRGAKFSICLASQTISDFVAKAKDKAEASRILANLNNFVALRCNDVETQKFLTERIPKTRIQITTKSHGVSTSSKLVAHGASISERITEEETDLVASSLLGTLPNCEFFGIFAGGHVIKGRVPILVKNKAEFRENA